MLGGFFYLFFNCNIFITFAYKNIIIMAKKLTLEEIKAIKKDKEVKITTQETVKK